MWFVTYHQSSQGTRLHPTVNMIQNSSSFSFDLYIIADIPPVEYRGLLLNVCNLVDAVTTCELCTTGFARLLITEGLVGMLLHLLAGKHENLALGTFRSDRFSSYQVQSHEQNREGYDNGEVAPLVRVNVAVC